MNEAAREAAGVEDARCADLHRVFGWWALLVFLALGVFLEALHGIKAAFYLDPAHVLRRELWTLAHTHGTLLALVNLTFSSHHRHLASRMPAGRMRMVSHLLRHGALLIPTGFFLGGAFATEHDPWSGVLLVPVGAICLVIAVGLAAHAASRKAPAPP